MLSFTFKVENPFCEQVFHNLFNKCWQVSKTKFLEFEILYYRPDLIAGHFHWTIREDHAGIYLSFHILGLGLSFDFYDCRHWDLDKNKWCEGE